MNGKKTRTLETRKDAAPELQKSIASYAPGGAVAF